jgi:hypothetical protein
MLDGVQIEGRDGVPGIANPGGVAGGLVAARRIACSRSDEWRTMVTFRGWLRELF